MADRRRMVGQSDVPRAMPAGGARSGPTSIRWIMMFFVDDKSPLNVDSHRTRMQNRAVVGIGNGTGLRSRASCRSLAGISRAVRRQAGHDASVVPKKCGSLQLSCYDSRASFSLGRLCIWRVIAFIHDGDFLFGTRVVVWRRDCCS